MAKSPFNDIFVRLSHLYLKPDWNLSDLLRSQMIQDDISRERDNNTITLDEHKVLYAMVWYLNTAMRDSLRAKGEFYD